MLNQNTFGETKQSILDIHTGYVSCVGFWSNRCTGLEDESM